MKSLDLVRESRPAALPNDDGDGIRITPLLKSNKTITGQSVALPQGDVEVVLYEYEMAPGTALPVHKHPYPHYAYILSGTLRIFNEDTGQSRTFKPGDFIIEAFNQWHTGMNVGQDPVRMIVIDQVPKGEDNIIEKE
ncbi:hypothetical protein GCM10011491_25780 [Brucella endophytica]|uniref:Cupin type-2 domain-containing protein n=1 Tax=Brucella endophytica TaxID=1963359 RepID=A0A916SGG7_9HYPH|nr:cupin domain-containing protein [Brucella endophytica]GGA96232.1 hypothetical protein GCM10011491_25780 [Brucella endophytica]